MDLLERPMAAVRAELEMAAGSAEAMAGRCAELGALLDPPADPRGAGAALEAVAALLSGRTGPAAAALFDFVAGRIRALPEPAPVLAHLLEAASEELRERAVALAAALAREGRLRVEPDLVAALARIDEATPLSSAALAQAGELLRRLPAAELPAGGAAGPAEALFRAAPSRRVRRLAGRLLDGGRRPPLDVLPAWMGKEAAAFLAPYLEHSNATHRDLVDLAPPPGQPPPCLEGLRRAAASLGEPLLREVVGRLGWPRLSCGFLAQPRVALSVGGSFPFVVSPAQARLLAAAGKTERLWRRNLIVAHGGPVEEEQERTSDDVVRRFRGYNVTHAELLDEILAVAPLDDAKAERILSRMDRVVADFAALFRTTSDDARRVEAVYQGLRQQARAGLARDHGRGAPSGETVRRIQMFEDPQRLDEVTTVHGLKRYLHQQGLRLAFRLFQGSQAANRSVDLLVTDQREVLRCEQVIRYLEFEPTPPVGSARLPFVVSQVAEALGRQLLHGRKLPWVTILGFANELQIYVSYRNHPAFVRLDLSPPRRGGMIDLEYFAVSQYELDQHPDLSLQAIQQVLRELDFDVSRDGLRLRARYDKERAVDLGDVVARSRALFELLPYLMDVDWIIGDLDYPAPARPEVAAAWARFFARWGVIPAEEVLGAGRRKVVVGIEPDPAGPRERVWDGRAPYRDRFSGTPPDGFAEGLWSELERRGLGALASPGPAAGSAWGQRALEQALLAPLDEAVLRGELRETEDGFEQAPPGLFERQHEAERLGALVAEGGAGLRKAMEVAELVRGVERQARFRTTGSIQGHEVQAASLPTAPRPVGLFVLRDTQGMVRLALASDGGVLYRARAELAGAWCQGPELGAAELARILRAHNYLGAGLEVLRAPGEAEVAELRDRLSAPSTAPVPRWIAGERVVPGTLAAPGRATGFARFHTAGRQVADLEGAVLLARAVRPEDGPWLRRAAAIVSTGGGVLSHVGMIALELGKPAMIVEGRWGAAPSGAEVLTCRRPRWRESEAAVGGLQVVSRRELREAEEVLEEGDLVTVDAGAEGLEVLGRDAQALALHAGLEQLSAASTALAATASDAEVLACRGRLLRAGHQLGRLLARLERPELARHAVRELLTFPRTALAPEGREARVRLLHTLLESRSCRDTARAAVSRRLADLRGALEAARAAALAEVPRLSSPHEVEFTRLGVWRLEEALSDALDLLGEPGGAERAATGAVDEACRRRLGELRRGLEGRVRDCPPEEAWRLRHLLPRLEQVAMVLDGAAPGDASAEDARRRADGPRLRALEGRRVLDMAGAGIELRPLVGGKAAHLGEIARALGGSLVPPWFVVTDAAFREALALPVPPEAAGRLEVPAGAALGETIAWVGARTGWTIRRQSAAIRGLWQAAPLPAGLDEEIAAAYRRLAPGPGEDAMVAIRSSAREEDAEEAAWAGQFDTFLYVRGLEALLEHLRLAWAGLWTERAIDQRRLAGAGAFARGGGVVVQQMVEARASGVLHTACAATGQLREMVINAGLGLGEGVVSGTVDVDHILVSKDAGLESGELRLRYRVGDKREQVVLDRARGSGTLRQETRYHQRLRAALEYVELCELVRAAARLEEAFLEPLDVEFAIEGRGLRILQARPVPVFDAAWREALARHPLSPGRRPPGEEAP